MVLLLLALILVGCQSVPRAPHPLARYRPDVKAVAVRQASKPPRATPPPATGVQPSEQPDAEPGSESRYLRSGDKIMIHLRGIPTPDSIPYVVDESGNINLPYVGRINVAGKACAEAEKLIERAYIEGGIYKTISVQVIPPENEFFVRGYVNRPGKYTIGRNMTVMQAIAVAGGWNEFADPTKISLVRGTKSFPINASKVERREEPDMALEPGDTIVVPKGWY